MQMANKHKKSLAITLLIRGLQVKTIVRHYFTLVRISILKSLQVINAGDSVEKKEPPYTVGRNENWHNY